ncbi:dihydrofolate reductase family protein [Saccharomonospora azurea]|uniref:dihydrofolate reductase family protein n=1 Tax=Saccharomonospora azurea TaxID=40988 RepID=UPI0024098617|nr:dihydrofolate reductase family protein [Saccharomonospora azurea]
MGIVRWHTTLSVDGFVAGPDHAMDWAFAYPDPIPEAEEVIERTGAILCGRGTYDVGRRPGQRPEAREAFGGAWRGRQFVLTHRPPDDERDPSIEFLSGGIDTAVDTALAAAGGRDLLVLGADVARQCVERGLVDELLVHVVPVLLGGGVRLFDATGVAPVQLGRPAVTVSGAITTLRFRLS